MITLEMKIPSNENIVKSLEVDDIKNGLIIKTTYNKNLKNLELLVKTNTIGSLKNILDDYFVNYNMVMDIIEINEKNDNKIIK
ncbi:KEOPS complex subunit Pcc1 [Methanothermococcus okinawensis]|uniref:Uncharacterized protein n=1 Tax=Methanothermococcus okinawensis (strain DSM 14208 / JCM 11175 / IH1) TaxID=647113 RepID=F8ANK5_METOI|nr:KEOPS complex subunit Pcc1 [Methanothermococcus okinawensis]AEH07059.1 hypothetical protein Metok_1089 [Methanothermococcus okinawensis IH1]